MDTTPISFADLRNKQTGNTAVMIAVIFPEDQNWEEFQYFLADELGFSKGKNVTACRRITGNILGDEGRWDYLLEFDNPEIPFNPIARLKFPDLKWTSDYIDNFSKDYEV